MTPVVRALARRAGIVDRAKGDALKIHEKPVALLGGLAVAVAWGLGFFVFRTSYFARCEEMLWIITGAILVFGVGLWDDIKEVKPGTRLLVHMIAGVLVVTAGVKISFIPVEWVAIPLTLLYIAGSINALNMTDGMDGLCAGMSLISCAGFFFLGFNELNQILMMFSSVLFMSLFGFLPYNFHPARIFLGDAGSGFLGFMLGLMAVLATPKPFEIANFVAPILIIGVPVFDMAFAILRRLIRRKPLFIGDRDHLYDLLLRKGWSQPKVWGVMCGGQLALVAIALGIMNRM